MIKLKVAPGCDVDRARRLADLAPEMAFAVDGNGAYPPGETAPLLDMAAAGARYVEQPYPRGSDDDHRRLRAALPVPLVLDEDVRSVRDAMRIVAADAADVLVVKPSVLGISGSLAVHDLAAAAGLRVKPSGFIESSIGRAHAAALATLPAAVWPDHAGAMDFLAVDPVRSSGAGGIGLDVDETEAAPFLIRAVTIQDR